MRNLVFNNLWKLQVKKLPVQALFTAEYLEKFEEIHVLSIFFTIWVKKGLSLPKILLFLHDFSHFDH